MNGGSAGAEAAPGNLRKEGEVDIEIRIQDLSGGAEVNKCWAGLLIWTKGLINMCT